MTDQDRLADLFNVGPEFEYKNKKISIPKELNLLQMARYSRWLEERAMAFAARSTHVPSDIQNQLLAVVADRAAAGVFEWGGSACIQALKEPAGIARLLYECMRDEFPEITEEETRKLVDDKLNAAAMEALRQAADPKVQALLDQLTGGMFSQSSPSKEYNAAKPCE